MTTFKSDSQGFLIADAKAELGGMTQGIHGVKRDTGAILGLLRKESKANLLQRAKVEQRAKKEEGERASTMRASSRATAADTASTAIRRNGAGGTAARDPATGRFIKTAEAQSANASNLVTAVNSMTRQQAAQAATEKLAAASRRNREGNSDDAQNGGEMERDGKGRFIGGAADEASEREGFFARMKGGIQSAFARKDMGEIDKVDPLIEASNEVRSLVSGPLGMAAAIGKPIIGRNERATKDKEVVKTNGWLRRMMGELRIMRKENRDFSKAEQRAIKDIKPGGAGEESPGFFGTFFGSLLGRIAPLLMTAAGAALAAIFSPIGLGLIAAATAAWMIFTEDGRKAFKAMSEKLGSILSVALNPIAEWFRKAFPNAGKADAPNPNGVSSRENTDPDGYRTDKGTRQRRDMLQKQYDAAKNDPKKAVYADNLKKEIARLDAELKHGARKRQAFDGIAGGDNLRRYGTYTDAEATQIKQLKSSGANTSANLKGGMPKEVQEKIIAQATAAGLDPQTMLKVAAMESGGNANAISSTGAIGIYQFTGRTATGVGIKNRFNADENIAGGIKLAKQHVAMLTKAKLPVTAENLYMMHQLGPDAAKEVIVGAKSGKKISELSKGTRQAVALNYGATAKTAAEYIGKNSAALSNRADNVIGKSEAGYLPARPAVAAASSPSIAAAPASSPVIAAAAPVSAPRVKAPAIAIPLPAAAPPAATASIPVPMNSKAPVEVMLADNQLAKQDLKDRRLAHIATGGIGV